MIKKITIIKYHIKKIYISFYRKYQVSITLKYIIPISICIWGILGMSWVAESNWNILISIVAGLLFAKLTELFKEVIYYKMENWQKIKNFAVQYADTYRYEIFFSQNKVIGYYNSVFTIKNENENFYIEIEDFEKKYFVLDSLIQNNYISLLHAHRNDYIKNYKCVRLDDYEIDFVSNHVKLITSRAKCFDHLATNFAMDYKMEKGMTLRDIYEYQSILTPLCKSKMANVLGINALVFLSDGILLMPLRGARATISKHMLTSSIALGCFWENRKNDEKLKIEDIMEGFVCTGLIERLHLKKSVLEDKLYQIHFLGFGRDVYWGGKPQLYYYVTLQMNSKEYLIKSQHDKKNEKFDQDSEILLVQSFDVLNDSGDLKLRCIRKKKLIETNSYKFYSKSAKAEDSFFNNCLHFSKYSFEGQEENWLKNMIMN